MSRNRNRNSNSNGNGKSNSKGNGKSKRRFPSGMTNKRVTARLIGGTATLAVLALDLVFYSGVETFWDLGKINRVFAFALRGWTKLETAGV
jgi:hypothetical protein